MTLAPDQAGRLLREAAIDPGESLGAQSPLERVLPARVGPYLATRLIASGGMGSVYEATQPSLNRPVALKLIHPYSLSPRAVERFRFEATILSRLRHPNIAAVYDAGTARIEGLAGEWPYYAMELIDSARPIHTFAQRNRLSIERRLRLLIDAADAVHHAHQHAIIHRDIKPDNILVGADGVPKIIDFGIAASLQSDPNATLAQTFHTQTGQLLGSFQFMAPEQFDSADVDVRADVYALGMILYLLLTDTLPYDVSKLPIPAAASRIKTSAIRPPSSLRGTKPAPASPPRLHKDLDAITLMALAPNPEKRYSSAAALAADLRAHLNDDPITARPPTRWQRAVQWIGRHPVGATVAACLSLVVLTLAAVGSTFVALQWFSLQPHSVEIDRHTHEVFVESLADLVVSSRPPPGDWIAADAMRVDRPSDWIVVIAEYSPSKQRARTIAYSPSNLDDPLWALDLAQPGLLTPPHESFRVPEPDDHWGISSCQCADVFTDIPGDEVILRITHTPDFPSAIAILASTDGRPIHIAWHTGHIAQIAWCPVNRLLVVAGVNNRLPWTDLGAPPTTNPADHPSVVFAYTPTEEIWNDAWLASPTGAAHSSAWYAVCNDPIATKRFKHPGLSDIGGARLGGFPLHFQMGALYQYDGIHTMTGPAWRIGPEGPLSENLEISSEFRASPNLHDADNAKLILLTDYHPIGDRDYHTEMNGPP